MRGPAYTVKAMVKTAKFNTGRVMKELGLQLDRIGSQYSHDIAYLKKTSRHKSHLPIYDNIP